MSYVTARPYLVSLIEGAAPSVAPAVFGDSFTYERNAIVEDIPGSRVFQLQAIAASSESRGHTGARQTTYEVTVSVYYREHSNTEEIDEVRADDYRVIREALLDESQWSRPTSTIVSVARGGADIIISSVSEVDAGSVLDITFPFTVTN